MKSIIFVLIGIFIFFISPTLLAEDQKKAISADEAMKYYCKTWVNPAYNENKDYTAKKIMNKDGMWDWYDTETSDKIAWSGSFDIEKSWIDKDGNVWLKMIVIVVEAKKYTVAKISDGGNTLEQVYSY